MKRPPIKSPPAYVLVDSDGRIRWGILGGKRYVSAHAEHPARRVVRLSWKVVRKAKVRNP